MCLRNCKIWIVEPIHLVNAWIFEESFFQFWNTLKVRAILRHGEMWKVQINEDTQQLQLDKADPGEIVNHEEQGGR